MAGYPVVFLDFNELWLHESTLRMGVGTARVEVTSRWWIDGTRYLTADNFVYTLGRRVGHGDRRDKGSSVGMQWVIDNRVRFAKFNYLAKVHDCYSITHVPRKREVVSDV